VQLPPALRRDVVEVGDGADVLGQALVPWPAVLPGERPTDLLGAAVDALSRTSSTKSPKVWASREEMADARC